MTKNIVIGRKWTEFKPVSDGDGGMLMEPQNHEPIHLDDLSPPYRGVIEAFIKEQGVN